MALQLKIVAVAVAPFVVEQRSVESSFAAVFVVEEFALAVAVAAFGAEYKLKDSYELGYLYLLWFS